MKKQYTLERKIKVATKATEMKKAGQSIDEISELFDIPMKTLAKWVLKLKKGELKLPEKKEKPSPLPSQKIDLDPLLKAAEKTNKLLEQNNIRLDQICVLLKEQNEIANLANEICQK